MRVSAREARRLVIVGQRLAVERRRPTHAGILETVRDIGYLQLDPTNVVARNPLLVLWSRVGRYDPALLSDLLEKRRELFETPSLILPRADLAVHAATMRAYRRATDPRAARAHHAPADVEERVRAVREGWEGRATLLSPFDNLVIDRDRLEQLFGYRYRMEIYTPRTCASSGSGPCRCCTGTRSSAASTPSWTVTSASSS